ncbi:hypothetical protein SRHO_G00332820 [Serrasalmus rhombeus]
MTPSVEAELRFESGTAKAGAAEANESPRMCGAQKENRYRAPRSCPGPGLGSRAMSRCLGVLALLIPVSNSNVGGMLIVFAAGADFRRV